MDSVFPHGRCAINAKMQVGHGGFARVARIGNQLPCNNTLAYADDYTVLPEVVVLTGLVSSS